MRRLAAVGMVTAVSHQKLFSNSRCLPATSKWVQADVAERGGGGGDHASNLSRLRARVGP